MENCATYSHEDKKSLNSRLTKSFINHLEHKVGLAICMAKIRYKILVETLDNINPKAYWCCWRPPNDCTFVFKMGPV
jgi:hypothetical protein